MKQSKMDERYTSFSHPFFHPLQALFHRILGLTAKKGFRSGLSVLFCIEKQALGYFSCLKEANPKLISIFLFCIKI
jgi:hypothetical protein